MTRTATAITTHVDRTEFREPLPVRVLVAVFCAGIDCLLVISGIL